MSDNRYYITSNLALCGYLDINGLRYVKAELSRDRNDKFKVDFYFLDPENKGSDLEWNYKNSDIKKYRDAIFYYRKIINDKLGS